MLAVFAYRLADALARHLPSRAVDRLAVLLARAAFALHVPARRSLERNLSRLLAGEPPGAIRACVRAAFEHFALAFAEFLRLARLDRAALGRAVELRGAEHLAAARASGRGVILLSAHLGNWELGAAFLSVLGERVHIVARAHSSRAVERFFAHRRRRWGVRRLASRPVWVRAAQALRRREWVAMMGDRGVPGSAASSCAWAAALARRTGALLLPAIMVRLPDGRYAACFEAPIPPQRCANGVYRDTVLRYLARYPGQWCGFEPLPEGLA